jgi:hypothetical protein
MSCERNGIAEPITWSITQLLSHALGNEVDRDAWLAEAVARGSLPLLERVIVSLQHLSKLEDIGKWAKVALNTVCLPARSKYPYFH